MTHCIATPKVDEEVCNQYWIFFCNRLMHPTGLTIIKPESVCFKFEPFERLLMSDSQGNWT